MAPLYPPGLDENSAGANFYPACWICNKKVSVPGTNCITAEYNFCTEHENQLLAGTIFVPGSQVQREIFVPGSQMRGTHFLHFTILIFTENHKKKNSSAVYKIYDS